MKRLLIIFMPVLFVTSVVYAAPHEKDSYIEGNIGSSSYSRIKYTPDFNYSDRAGVGLNVNLGHLFNRYVAAEMGYTRYNLGGDAPGGVDLAAKFIYPFRVVNSDLNVFAKIGSTYLFDAGSDIGLHTFLGIGVAYQVTPMLDLSVQVQDSYITIDGCENPKLLSLGLTYHFAM